MEREKTKTVKMRRRFIGPPELGESRLFVESFPSQSHERGRNERNEKGRNIPTKIRSAADSTSAAVDFQGTDRTGGASGIVAIHKTISIIVDSVVTDFCGIIVQNCEDGLVGGSKARSSLRI